MYKIIEVTHMFEEIELYLRSITTPENVEVIMKAKENIELAGIISHELDLETILRTADQHESEQNLLDIFAVMSSYVEKVINEFGLYVNEAIPLSILNHVLESLLLIADYGDPEGVLTILNSDSDPVEKICDIFATVHALQWHDFAPHVVKINESLLERIEEVCLVSLPVEQEEDIDKYRNRVNRFRDRFQGSFAYIALSDGFSLKTPLETLIGRYNEELAELETKPDELTKAIMGLVVVSNVKDEDIQKEAFLMLEDLAKDINVVTKATPLLKELVESF